MTSHSAEYVAKLFRGEHLNYDQQPIRAEVEGLPVVGMHKHREARIDCGTGPAVACHPPDYVARLFLGEHLNYDLQPIPLKVGEPPLTSFAWIKCLHPHSASGVFVAAGWGQNMTPQVGGEIYFFPLGICKYLLLTFPSDWQQVTVVPGTVSFSTDTATGLDSVGAISSLVWGIDAFGQPFFTLDGDIGSGEGAQMSVDNNNDNPVLTQ